MRIKKIRISGFRNIADAALEFDEYYNLLHGENASGKTSIIEAVYVCAFGRSFRGRDAELVRNGSEFCRVEAFFEKAGIEKKVEYAISPARGKWFKIDGKNVRTTADIIENISVVLFCPDDLEIVKSGPAVRRTFLNKEISALNKLYYADHIKYGNVLKQRNALLKKRAGDIDIEVWNEALIESACGLVSRRLSFLRVLDEISRGIHLEISDGKEVLEISYRSAYLGNNGNADIPVSEVGRRLSQSLAKNLERDKFRGFSCVGPHTDDFEIKINGMSAKSFASQGQQRTAALSLKLAEVVLIKRETGHFPIVLLDDILSELDSKRQSQIEKVFEKAQTIVTNTEDVGGGNKVRVSNGKIIK